MKTRALLLAIAVGLCVQLSAQNDLIVSQYIHNRFAVNPALAGSREVLSVFGSYRMQWTGITGQPKSILLTGHTSLKNEQIVVGLGLYNQTIRQSQNSGLQATVGYRVRATEKTWFGMALQPGASLRSSDWSRIATTQAGDESFSEKMSSIAPLLGFGLSWYGDKFFLGASVVSLFVSDDFDQRDAKFDPEHAAYIATAGYLFSGETFSVQPSVLASYQTDNLHVDGTLSVIVSDFIWIDAGYRTNKEITAGLAVQALPQLRIAYNYDYQIGDLKGYSSGSHEISLQYDFAYKTKNVGPKFY